MNTEPTLPTIQHTTVTPHIKTPSLWIQLRTPFLLFTLLIAGLGGWWFLQPRETAETACVVKSTAISAVYGTVSVEPVSTTLVRTQSSGIISKVNVKKGDTVRQNDILAQISDEAVSLQIQEAEHNLAKEKQRLEIGPMSKNALETKRDQVMRLKKLFEESNISKSEYDRNVSELKSLEEQMQNEWILLRSAVTDAEQKLQAAQTTSRQGVVTSPQEGIVLDFYSQLGEVTTARQELFLIASKETHIRAQVNEEDVGSLKIGMIASVRLYSFQNTDFEATLQEILPKGENMVYSVILKLKNPPTNLLSGMTGELNIITGKHENTLIIPTRCLRNGSSVFLVQGNKVIDRQVKIGYRSIENTEILEGLEEGDLVIMNNIDLFKIGQRVNTKIVYPSRT